MKRILSLALTLVMFLSVLCTCATEAQAFSFWKKKNITVHAYVPSDWENPGCWAWSTLKGKDAFDAWPGEAMTEEGEWYVIEVPDWVNYVIINGNEGTVQTADLPVEVGRELWVVVEDPETATVFYEETAALEAAEKTKGLSPDEIYAALGTLKEEQITDFKAVICKYEIFDEEERSREVVLDYLTGVEPAKVPEEVRYLVNVKYQSIPALGYIGTVKVYRRSIYAEVIDVLTMEVIGKQSFAGSGLPDHVTSTTGSYFGDYPDEAEVQAWILDTMYAGRNELVKQVRENYLGKGYSRTSLQETLTKYGEYDAGMVRYALDNCGADWNNEALIVAKNWLERGNGYTPQQLLENLVEISGFTQEQAAYGMENCGADWNQEALKVAKYFLEIELGYSHSSMIKVLVGDYGFTEVQAKYAADNCGADWNEVAVDHVKLFMKYAEEPYTREEMIEEMVNYFGFTEEQAIYAVNKVGLK